MYVLTGTVSSGSHFLFNILTYFNSPSFYGKPPRRSSVVLLGLVWVTYAEFLPIRSCFNYLGGATIRDSYVGNSPRSLDMNALARAKSVWLPPFLDLWTAAASELRIPCQSIFADDVCHKVGTQFVTLCICCLIILNLWLSHFEAKRVTECLGLYPWWKFTMCDLGGCPLGVPCTPGSSDKNRTCRFADPVPRETRWFPYLIISSLFLRFHGVNLQFDNHKKWLLFIDQPLSRDRLTEGFFSRNTFYIYTSYIFHILGPSHLTSLHLTSSS